MIIKTLSAQRADPIIRLSAYNYENIAGGNGSALRNSYFLYGAVAGGEYFVLHLHSLKNNHALAVLYSIADIYHQLKDGAAHRGGDGACACGNGRCGSRSGSRCGGRSRGCCGRGGRSGCGSS